MSGYTGSDKDQKVGTVHRGELFGPCVCGGRAHSFWDGELISHTEPFNPDLEHSLPPNIVLWGFDFLYDME